MGHTAILLEYTYLDGRVVVVVVVVVVVFAQKARMEVIRDGRHFSIWDARLHHDGTTI